MVLARGGAFFRRAGVGAGSRKKVDKQEAILGELSETLGYASSTLELSRCSNQFYPFLF